MLVSDVMTRSLKTVAADATISRVGDMMKEFNIRHLVIVEPGTNKLVGIVSDRDIKKIISPFAGSNKATDRDNATLQVKVGLIMHRDPLVISKPGDNLKSLAELMLQKKVSAVAVVDDKQTAIGIVTTDDMLKTLIKFL